MRVELDPWTRRLRPTIVFGGTPPRFLRLSSAGASAMDEIEMGVADSRAARALVERLVAAGMAHRRPQPAPVEATRTVSVVIPVYDRVDGVRELVAGLCRSAPALHEIIIVDDASPPDSARRLAEFVAATDGVRLVHHETNRGPAAARNTGLALVTTPRVLFLDSDCVVDAEPGWLEALLGHFESEPIEPRVAAVAPRVAPLREQKSGVVENYDLAFCPLDMGGQASLVGPDRRIRYVPTAALLLDREVFGDAATLGELFDPDLRFGEDVDFVWRLVHDGFRVLYDPAVHVGHREPATIKALLRRRFDYGSSAAELDGRHRGAVNHLTISPLALAATAGVVAGSAPLAGASYAAQVVSLGRQLRRANLPNDQLFQAVATSTVQSGLGVGRYLNQFWWPLVVAVLLNGRVAPAQRVRLAALCLARSLEEAWRTDGSVRDRATIAALRTVDEAAYGAGVWRGALAARTLSVIAPRFSRWKPKVS